VIVVNPTTVRLAESRWQALEGTYVELDPSTAEGASHTIVQAFRQDPWWMEIRTPFVSRESTVSGTARPSFYESGGGTPIGGLTSGDTY